MPITIRPVQPLIGAEITGIDLREPLSDTDLTALRAAWVKYGVLFFRNQPISRERHVEFGRLFAELFPPVAPRYFNEYPEIHSVITDGRKNEGAANIWHADLTCFRRPSAGSILKAYAIPSLGGDTVFSSAVAAYAGLSDAVKARIRHLWAMHDVAKTLAGKAAPDKVAEMTAMLPPVERPVVRIHPESGVPVLYVNEGFTTHIVGMDAAESDSLLHHLFEQIKKPEYQVRFAWQVDSIAFWDNRQVQHYAVTDYNEPRHLESVVLLDDQPYGFDEKAD
jgi:alpha-ketoglutarate-dependent taurine dioxygenase